MYPTIPCGRLGNAVRVGALQSGSRLPHYFPTPPHSSLLVPSCSFSIKPWFSLENGAAAWD
jgi:hypothetical protein